jgi:hypothetical protein
MDPTSGYRAINREVIKIFAHNYPKDYPEHVCFVSTFNRAVK